MLRKESCVAGFLFCVGEWWLSGRRQGTCRPLTDATLWRTGGLQIFWEDFGAGPLNAAGGLCKELTFLRLWQGITYSRTTEQKASELCTAHPRPSGSPSFPQKRTHKKVHLRTQTDPLTPKTTHERSSPIQ